MAALNQPAGNYFDKYNSSNIFVKKIMRGFFDSLEELLKKTNPTEIIDVGCGEGYITKLLADTFPNANIRGVDVAAEIIDVARSNFPDLQFAEESIYSLPYPDGLFDLVVSCEVLEHLQDPEEAMQEILRVSSNQILLSVPREPIWRVSNFLRGKYLGSLGNTPGHVQHWSQNGFIDFVSQFGKIECIRNPFPWTMVLLKKEVVL